MKKEYIEELTEIKNIKIDRKCSSCDEGYLLSSGKVLFSNPIQYEHKCTICKKEETLSKKYPYMTQIEIPFKEIILKK